MGEFKLSSSWPSWNYKHKFPVLVHKNKVNNIICLACERKYSSRAPYTIFIPEELRKFRLFSHKCLLTKTFNSIDKIEF